MNEKAYLPILGENIESGDIIAINCKVGDFLKEGDSICEIETDKATVDIPTQTDCKITDIKIKVGDTVNVGDHIISFDRLDASTNSKQPETQVEAPSVKTTQESSATTQSSDTTQNIGKLKITIPVIGEGIETVVVNKILVQVGDKIEKGTNLVEIESDKASVDLPSEADGIVESVLINEGDVCQIGDQILSILTGNAGQNQELEKISQPTQQSNAAQSSPKVVETKAVQSQIVKSEIVIPVIGEGIETVVINKIHVKIGDKITQSTNLVEIESDKANVDVPSDSDGIVESIDINEGDICKIGDKIISILGVTEATNEVVETEPIEKPVEPQEKVAPQNNTEVQETFSKKVKTEKSIKIDKNYLVPASPSVRRFAREIGIDIKEVEGSGYKNRISIDDVKKYSKAKNTKQGASPSSSLDINDKLPDFQQFGEIEILKVNKIKQITAVHMKRSWLLAPRVTQFDQADITELEKLRKKYKEQYKGQGINITMTSILVKAIVFVLKEFPQFNSSYDELKNELIIKKYYNIGIAVDTENGLLVPNIKKAESKNILTISQDLMELSQKAKSRKLSPDESSGGTFTISNLGGIAGTQFTPIVSWPEAAILGVSKSQIQPVYIDGSFQPRLIMPLALSYDHKVVDGAEGARFMKRLVEILQEPFLMAYF